MGRLLDIERVRVRDHVWYEVSEAMNRITEALFSALSPASANESMFVPASYQRQQMVPELNSLALNAWNRRLVLRWHDKHPESWPWKLELSYASVFEVRVCIYSGRTSVGWVTASTRCHRQGYYIRGVPKAVTARYRHKASTLMSEALPPFPFGPSFEYALLRG